MALHLDWLRVSLLTCKFIRNPHGLALRLVSQPVLLCTVSEESKQSVGVVPAPVLGAIASRYTVASLEELKRSVGVVPAVVLGAVASRYTLASLEELKWSVLLACSGSTSSCASVWIFFPSRESVKNSHTVTSMGIPNRISVF